MVSRFADQVVVITGAGAGVGRTYAHAFAAEGANVAVVDLDAAAADSVTSEIRDAGFRAVACPMDVADADAAVAMVERVSTELGGVDILVNNAGVHLEHGVLPVEVAALPRWRRLFEVNLMGALICATACVEPMRRRGGGVIVNQSSSGAWRCEEAYDVSKMALNALTAVLGHQLAEAGIRLVGVAPGLIATPAAMASFDPARIDHILERQQVKRVMTSEDLTSTLLFLCSKDASFIAGTTVVVDGGMRQKAW